jgi:hypothetical protein
MYKRVKIDPDEWSRFQTQGWRLGPLFVRESEVSVLTNEEFTNTVTTNNTIQILESPEPLLRWRCLLHTVVTFSGQEEELKLSEIVVKHYPSVFRVFNIEMPIEFLFRVGERQIRNSHWGRANGAISVTSPFRLVLFLQLKATPKPDTLSWAISEDGIVFRGRYAQGSWMTECDGIMAVWSKKKKRDLAQSTGYAVHLKCLSNLRSSHVIYCLRYLMLVLECDTPVLEAVFANWYCRDSYVDHRIFPSFFSHFQRQTLPCQYRIDTGVKF